VEEEFTYQFCAIIAIPNVGTSLQYFSSRNIIFMNENGNVVDECNDEKWLWDLALLCDISWHLNDVQVWQTLVSDMFRVIKSFQNEAETVLRTAGKY
jgi:hypothetical protein